ncbi:MAG: chromosomal replication initiator protein DnaA [Kiritimatiellia bacterium]
MSDNDVVKLWSKTSDHLKRVLRPDVFSRWIGVIEPHSLEGSRLVLAVDNDFYQSWLKDNYLPLISETVEALHGTRLDIDFTVAPRAHKPPEPKPKKKKSLRDRLIGRRTGDERPTLNAKFMFDEFIVGPSNQFAHAASLAVAQAPAQAYNPLFIYGDVGLGKTHLMQAVGHHVLAASRSSVCYVSSEAFTNEYINALQNRNLPQFRKKYRKAGLLLIDDIHFLAGKERLQEEFFHTFNALFDSQRQIVMTSDRPASEITKLENRLVSRFEWGLVTELAPPDLETRIAILQHKQSKAQVKLPDEFLLFIAQNIRSNIRRLEGALIRSISYTSLTGRTLTPETLKSLLRDALEEEKNEAVTIERIQKVVAEHFDVRIADMMSRRRPRHIALPRQVAMYLCRRMTRASLPDIANSFAKTHATVLHSYRTIEERMHIEDDLNSNIVAISRKLGRNLSGELTRQGASQSC